MLGAKGMTVKNDGLCRRVAIGRIDWIISILRLATAGVFS